MRRDLGREVVWSDYAFSLVSFALIRAMSSWAVNTKFEMVNRFKCVISMFLSRMPNERCSRQALFGCGFAAKVVACLQLN